MCTHRTHFICFYRKIDWPPGSRNDKLRHFVPSGDWTFRKPCLLWGTYQFVEVPNNVNKFRHTLTKDSKIAQTNHTANNQIDYPHICTFVQSITPPLPGFVSQMLSNFVCIDLVELPFSSLSSSVYLYHTISHKNRLRMNNTHFCFKNEQQQQQHN
jgi:hypothetical protein